MAMQIRKINIGTRDTVHKVALSDLGANDARAMDVSAEGTLYVADAGRGVVFKVFESGKISGTVVGSISTSGNVNSDGITVTGNSARLTTPHSICVDSSDDIYVGDGLITPVPTGYQLRRMSPSGRLVFFAGNQAFTGDVCNTITGNDGTISRFSPTATGMGICTDSAGVVYLADTGNHKVKKIWSSGRTTSMAGVSTGFANGTGGSAQFATPTDVAVDSHGNLYVADSANNRIRKITESGVVTTLSGTGTASFVEGNGATATFNNPIRICMDPSQQFMYVMDAGNAAVRKVDTSGKTNTFCSYNVPTGSTVGDICVDNSGFLYILEKV
jgi:sugar lactone lactonase YvrE